MGCGISSYVKADQSVKPVVDNYCVNDEPLSNKEKVILKETWPDIQQHSTTVGVEVFLRLFEQHPGYQDLFPEFRTISKEKLNESRPLLGHSRRIVKALDSAVTSLDDFENFEVYLVELGGRHKARQLQPIHLEHMRMALIDVICKRFASTWTKEVSLAYNKLFYMVAKCMLLGCKVKELTQGQKEARNDIEMT